MKKLALLRHAKAEADSPDGTDFARSLNERGRADAALVGEQIRAIGLSYDLVLSCPAKRAVETLEQVGGLSPQVDERIYNASAAELLGIVQQADDRVGRLMLVGHNPGFERLAGLLSGSSLEFATGALVEIELPIERWVDAGKGSGEIACFIRPKDLRQS